LKTDFSDIRAIYGDITDKDRLDLAMDGVDIVIHTAAMKNIILTEENPGEAIQINAIGTLNIARAAMKHHVGKAIFISSDKAVESVLLYGDLKAVGEKIWLWANRHSNSVFSIVRPGNFWVSQGNVFETWERQMNASQPITLTDPLMERYFIDIEQVALFIYARCGDSSGGEIFIPKMELYSMLVLAEEYNTNIHITGIRKGEKLIEKLWSTAEYHKLQDAGDYWLIQQPISERGV